MLYNRLYPAIAAVSYITTTFSHSHDITFPPLNLRPRQSNTTTTLIDPVTQPLCQMSSCWYYSSPPPSLCPLLIGPCPNDTSASDNGGKKCGIHQYSPSCYCSLKTGLSCAFSCNWKTWWETEDWFAALCPDSPALKLDFSSLPKCARNCLDDAIFQYGCLTQTSNCFCANGDLFGCQEKCYSEGEQRGIVGWLEDACGLEPARATAAVASGTFELSVVSETALGGVGGGEVKVGLPVKPKGKRLTWDEDFMLGVLALSFLVGVVLWSLQLCIRPPSSPRE